MAVAHHAHDISRLHLWQQLGARPYNFAVFVLSLTTRETPDSNARCVPRYHLGSTVSTHVKIQATLNDTEQILPLRVLVGLYAAIEPAN